MKTKNIRQEVFFDATPNAVYKALMDSGQHSTFTEEDAEIEDAVGGAFTAYGDYISGTNKELEKGKKIIQQWRASNWPEGHFSTVRYYLSKELKGTKLVFEHDGVPVDEVDSIADGWKKYYWDKMKNFFAKK